MANFSDVQEAQGSSMVLPGTIGIFTIKNAEEGTSKNGKEFVAIEFESAEGSSFKHTFYLVEKALSRIQHLWKHTHEGNLLSGDVTTKALVAGFIGKKVGLKVSGRISNNGKSYSDLAFGGFACDPTEDKVNELNFTPQEKKNIEDALNNMNNQSVSNADKETDTSVNTDLVSDADAF
jgi:hypothetical protein